MSKYFDIELNSSEENAEQYKELALKLKPDWPLDYQAIEIKCFQGGLTNALYACYLKSTGLDNKDTILIRIYGPGSDTICDRDKEIESMQKLSSIELGAKFYARFKNGIFYQYLPGSKISKEMLYNSSMYKKIAKGISRIHMIDYNGGKLPAGKELTIVSLTRQCFESLDENYKSYVTDDLMKLITSKAYLQNENNWLENYMSDYTRKHKSLIVFSHNDLNPGNIIVNNDEIKFIDFDFVGYGHQALDIANHFVEMSGFGSDYSDFPSKEYQLEWITVYLTEFYAFHNEFFKDDPSQHLVITEEKLNQFYEEVNIWTLESHMIAVVYGLIHAALPSTGFDWIQMTEARFKQYLAIKKRIIKNIE